MLTFFKQPLHILTPLIPGLGTEGSQEVVLLF